MPRGGENGEPPFARRRVPPACGPAIDQGRGSGRARVANTLEGCGRRSCIRSKRAEVCPACGRSWPPRGADRKGRSSTIPTGDGRSPPPTPRHARPSAGLRARAAPSERSIHAGSSPVAVRTASSRALAATSSGSAAARSCEGDRGPCLGDLDERTVERDRLAHERSGPAPEPALRGGEARARVVDRAERRVGAAQPAEAQRRRASVARLAQDLRRALVRLAGGDRLVPGVLRGGERRIEISRRRSVLALERPRLRPRPQGTSAQARIDLHRGRCIHRVLEQLEVRQSCTSTSSWPGASGSVRSRIPRASARRVLPVPAGPWIVTRRCPSSSSAESRASSSSRPTKRVGEGKRFVSFASDTGHRRAETTTVGGRERGHGFLLH